MSKYYIVRSKDDHQSMAKGTRSRGGNITNNDNTPPKLYKLGHAKSLVTQYKKYQGKDLEIVPVILTEVKEENTNV